MSVKKKDSSSIQTLLLTISISQVLHAMPIDKFEPARSALVCAFFMIVGTVLSNVCKHVSRNFAARMLGKFKRWRSRK